MRNDRIIFSEQHAIKIIGLLPVRVAIKYQKVVLIGFLKSNKFDKYY
jgi:hypothetical protein